MVRRAVRLEDVTLSLERQEQVFRERVAVVNRADLRQSRGTIGNMNVFCGFGQASETGVVAGRIFGEEDIGCRLMTDVGQPQGFDRLLLQGLKELFYPPFGLRDQGLETGGADLPRLSRSIPTPEFPFFIAVDISNSRLQIGCYALTVQGY